MSDVSTTVTEAHFRYIAERTRGEDAYLAKLKTAAEAEGIPPIWIAPEQASFLQVALKLAGARTVVEVGTLAGYSAISMARALPRGGRVDTIELEPRHADFARRWIAGSDVPDRVVVHQGAGTDVLARLASDSADACFIDADKANYPRYLDECLRIVRVGGLVMADNAFAFGHLLDQTNQDESVRHVRAFNEIMAREPRVHGIIVPLGDGCWIGVRVA